MTVYVRPSATCSRPSGRARAGLVAPRIDQAQGFVAKATTAITLAAVPVVGWMVWSTYHAGVFHG